MVADYTARIAETFMWCDGVSSYRSQPSHRV
nr:MAG TPA: hypothetical protein [Caudoviricetes sp.]